MQPLRHRINPKTFVITLRQIAKHLKIKQERILNWEKWHNVLWVHIQGLGGYFISYRKLEQWIAACSTLIRFCPNLQALNTLWESIIQEAQRYTEEAFSRLDAIFQERLSVLTSSRCKQTVNPPRVDWKSRDSQWAIAAKLSAERLKNALERPVQITVAAIARDIGQLANIQKHLDKLPLTAQVLVEVVETREQFAVRRVEYAAEHFRQENVCPQRWQLVRRAGLRPDIEATQQVKEAIAAALESLDLLGKISSV